MIFRNFINTLRSHKTASVLNILGLAIAFTAFYVISAQVWYSVTYNSAIKDSDRIYIVSPDWNHGLEGGPEWFENCPQPVTRETVAAMPEAEMYTWFHSFASPGFVWSRSKDGDFVKYNFGSYDFSTDGVDMFGFETVDGDLKRLAEPSTVIVSRSAAERMGCKVGDPIWFNGGMYFDDMESKTMMTVVGIFEDFPRNTFLYNHHIFRDDKCVHGQENGNWNYSAFVRLKKGADPDEFAKTWERLYAGHYMGMVKKWAEEYGEDYYEEGDEKLPVRLIPLDEMHFFEHFENSYYETASLKSIVTIAAIALLIIIIAFINFFNFYMSLIPSRIRGVNINKVLGASQRQLQARLVGEAVLHTFLALALAFCLILAVQDTNLRYYVTCSLSMKDNVWVLGAICLIMAFTAGLSALFPAIYTTRTNIAETVKAGFAQSKTGRILRSALVGLQFTVSMTLIIVTAVFFMQYKYMLDYDLGYNTENLLAFECRELAPHNETVIERLKQHPDVVAVTASHTGAIFSVHNVWGREIDGRQIQLDAFAVRWDFPEVMGIPMIEGEGFSGEGAAGQQIMFTRSTRPYVESLYEDGFFEEFEIKGTTDDLRLKSVGQADALTCLYTHPRYQLSTFYVRILPGADLRSLEKYIKEVVKEIEPRADEPEIKFIEESLKAYYYNTRRETLIMGLFALIAVLLSLMGVFSIVMFETRHKETEISIRKVYGATVEDVVRMFNRRYIIIVALCFCIATPLAWMLTGRWLQQFAHRIPVPFWIFPAVLALILAITVSIVSMRSLRAARTNPAEALKKE